MPTENKCPQCGKPVLPDALMGLCPDCMLKAGLGSGATSIPGDAPDAATVPPTPAELARFFPQLEILELLGRGGMGAVYKARQKQLDRVVALKILPPGIGHDAAFAERFVREAKALAKLNHPNIVTLYEFGASANFSTQDVLHRAKRWRLCRRSVMRSSTPTITASSTATLNRKTSCSTALGA